MATQKTDLLRISFYLAAAALLCAAAGCGGTLNASNAVSPPKSGCNASTTSGPDTATCPARTPVAGVSFTGKVSAGMQPVAGASVQLYAAGITGNGSAAAALLAASVTTGANGGFTIPGGYTCPSAQTPVYLLSKGGQPGSASAANASLWLMTALGECGAIGAGNTYFVNEATTVASVWALAPFMSSGGNAGASCTNTAGLDNAFATAQNLVNISTGTSPGAAIPSTLAVPSSKLNTLANALTACTASSGGSGCPALFNAAVSGDTVPGNTLDAALNIARAPANNVAAIYALASGSSLFSPALSAQPPDWMLANTVTGGGMSMPSSLGVAATGNIWVASYNDAVSEFLPSGAAVFSTGITGNGINQSFAMALDIEDNVWIANEQTTPSVGTGTVTELNSSGLALATGLTSGGIFFPAAVAADSNGNVWVVDYGDSRVTLLSPSGAAISSAPGWGGTALNFPVALAVDSNHNAWVANQSSTTSITEISADGSQVTNYDCDCNGASGIATDENNNVWMANYYGNSVSEVNSCGTVLLDAATGGGINHPQGTAIDGAGTAWVANYRGNSLSEISGSSSSTPGTFLSPSSGFGADASLLEPFGLAIDASGSIWVSNEGNDTLTQFIGAAAPVKPPLAGPPQLP